MKSILIFCLVLLPACATDEDPARRARGYSETQLSRSVFAGGHGVRRDPEIETNPADAPPLQFKVYPSFLLLSKTTPERIVFLESNAAQRTIVIGFLSDWENPCASIEEFKRKAALAAAILGGEGVQIQSEGGAARRGGSGHFEAALLLIPKARLGLLDEGGDWPRTELVVHGFDQGSLAPEAGLRVGDRIVAVNGIDVLREKRFADAWLSWSVGEMVVVTFIRDGVEMSLQAKTIAN
ncbi:MAG: PDZ domain-containing protein [Verrucomicrobiia bacterium]